MPEIRGSFTTATNARSSANAEHVESEELMRSWLRLRRTVARSQRCDENEDDDIGRHCETSLQGCVEAVVARSVWRSSDVLRWRRSQRRVMWRSYTRWRGRYSRVWRNAPPQRASLRLRAAPAQEPAVQVRSDFRSTILWLPDVKTDADGTATVKVKYPDSLTTWSATARVATAGNQFGIGNSTTRTKQPLIVRLQAPRFFVVGDQVTVSGVINNNTDEAMSVMPALNAEGLSVTGLLVDGKPVNGAQTPVEVKANSETRVDWLVAVTHASEAKLKVEARGSKYADAMEKTFTIFEHGIEKFISRSGKMRGDSVVDQTRHSERTSRRFDQAHSADRAQHGDDDARCAAVSDRLPVRLH